MEEDQLSHNNIEKNLYIKSMKKILILLFVLSLNNYAFGAGSDSSSDSSSETSLYDEAVKLVKRAGKLEKKINLRKQKNYILKLLKN